MPHLIVSDIHANLQALQAVLEDAQGQYDTLLCLGDFVDYGADPNAVVEWARQTPMITIRGNHDRVAAASDQDLPDAIAGFSQGARISAEWTRTALLEANRDFLARLSRGPVPFDGFDIVHGSPADEDEYLITVTDAAMVREDIETQLTFFGHTHRQGGFLLARQGAGYLDPLRPLEIEADYFYLVNPGSVGQPRDGDPRAAYALYWPVERVVEFHRVAYDIGRAAEKIRAAGLPEFLAARLFEGK